VPTFRRDRCRSPSPLASRKAQPCCSITIERQRSSSWYAPFSRTRPPVCRTAQCRCECCTALRRASERAAVGSRQVLHLINGNDHFISLSAEWQPSSFGRSLNELVRRPHVSALLWCARIGVGCRGCRSVMGAHGDISLKPSKRTGVRVHCSAGGRRNAPSTVGRFADTNEAARCVVH
jgi:hypothetical protein